MKLIYAGTTTQYLVELSAVKSNVIQVIGSLPMKEKGFRIIDDEGNEYDYSAFKTLYREVDGGYQYSNDGEVWEEPTKTVIVRVEWDDKDNAEGFRPESVTLTVVDGDTVIENLKLSERDSWQKVYENIPESHVYMVRASEIENYTMSIDGTIAKYALQEPEEPSIEQIIAELTNMVLELDERVHALEGGN